MTVTVYTKDSCRQCEATTRRLDEKQIPFTPEDATLPANTVRIKELGYQAAPVVVTDQDHWYGYRPDLIDQLAQRIGADA